MVSRVDRKPTIYGAGLVRFLRPALEQSNKNLLALLIGKVRGHGNKNLDPYALAEAFSDIDVDAYWAGMNINFSSWYSSWTEEEDEEIVRIARASHVKYSTPRAALRAKGMSDTLCDVYKAITKGVEEIYFGPEGSYVFMNKVINNRVFDNTVASTNWDWATESAGRVLDLQAPYCFMHASASSTLGLFGKKAMGAVQRSAWDIYKKVETVALRLGSRRNVLAHAFHLGTLRKPFEPAENLEEDFELPLTGFTQAVEGVRVYVLSGMRVIIVDSTMVVLTHDDCVSLSLLAQCWFRNAAYFCVWNGYSERHAIMATGVAKDMYEHICRLIGTGKNFADFIRSVHICAQKEFNDIYEKEKGDDLGWGARSINYDKEADQLDKAGRKYYAKCTALAVSEIDKLNVGMMYHMFVGDDMMISDLVEKVKSMPLKVLSADEAEWASFIKFSKSYLLARYMFSTKKRPHVGGDRAQMNNDWVGRCLRGTFSMPKYDDMGKVWIEGEFPWTNHADTWHLDAQDVAYVMKDLNGMKDGKYRADRVKASELLMAMECGDILDPLTGSSPASARERISKSEASHVVVLTTAPKAENAKPSWKKRVTFAADNEFRKMQAEYDRNARKVMMFLRGPSLGIDQTILEAQFSDIATKTGATTIGCVCSHDITAWSESMDRKRKFDFEQVLIDATTRKEMTGIKEDWAQIHAVINKAGAEKEFALTQGSFQGFDGSASTILHSLILLYCMESARRKSIIGKEVKTNLATLIDDCVAMMERLTDIKEANAFWGHLKATYRNLGFEVDELKSIFSTIKAIYLSRRFLLGGEVPADYKIFIKAHVSYEDPLRAVTDVPKDIFGALRGACDANGQAWFIYYSAVASSLAEMSHQCPGIMVLHPGATAVAALAPPDEMGWGFPSIVSWCTNDITDKRTHFNAIVEASAEFNLGGAGFTRDFVSITPSGIRMFNAIKSQPWRKVSLSGLFTNPFEAIREGPMKPDLLKRSAVSDILKEIVTAEPWRSLLGWNTSETTTVLREILASSGVLHAPTLSALVNCMPDNYRLSMLGKAIGSNSVLDILPRGMKIALKRRVHRVGESYVMHMANLYSSDRSHTTNNDVCVISHVDRTTVERDTFYRINGVRMTDHTFPDSVACFTRVERSVGSKIRPNSEEVRGWAPNVSNAHKVSEFISNKGMYVPRKSRRVWEVATEYGKGWDTVSQKIALGMAVLARARADGHETAGLLVYFIKAWNEAATLELDDTALIAIQGSVKRLDSNPGSSTHPITCHRNLSTAFIVDVKTAVNAISTVCVEKSGANSHLHDIHSHYTAMRCVTTLIFEALVDLKAAQPGLEYLIGLRRDCVIPASKELMTTDKAANRMLLEIMDSAVPYGLAQACPALARIIVAPTMQVSWVEMINALSSGDYTKANDILKAIDPLDLDACLNRLSEFHAEYSINVIMAAEPIKRHNLDVRGKDIFIAAEQRQSAVTVGDSFTSSIPSMPSKSGRVFAEDLPTESIVAVVIKSAVWQKLKNMNMGDLAAIVYGDTTADVNMLAEVNNEKFWKHVLRECCKHKLRGNLAEVSARAFHRLGVRGLRSRPSDDADAIAHSITSFFGASLKSIASIVSDEVCRVAGRSASAFAAPSHELTITHQPNVVNSQLRREHMNKLVKHNIESLTKRLDAIDNDSITHTGDKRACNDRDNTKVRRVFLQVRRMVYKSVKVEANGAISIDPQGLCNRVKKAAFTTIMRHVGTGPDWEEDEDGIKKIDKVAAVIGADFTKDALWEFLSKHDRVAHLDQVSEYTESLKEVVSVCGGYWNPTAGDSGLRYSVQQITEDSGSVQNTAFAISASELAPIVYRSIMTSSKRTKDIADAPIPEIPEEPISMEGMIDMSADDFDMDFIPAGFDINCARWQALATLLSTGSYTSDEVNAALRTRLPAYPSINDIIRADLGRFSDELIGAMFPGIDSHYALGSRLFSEDWFHEEDDSGYMVDEHGKCTIGGLI